MRGYGHHHEVVIAGIFDLHKSLVLGWRPFVYCNLISLLNFPVEVRRRRLPGLCTIKARVSFLSGLKAAPSL